MSQKKSKSKVVNDLAEIHTLLDSVLEEHTPITRKELSKLPLTEQDMVVVPKKIKKIRKNQNEK